MRCLMLAFRPPHDNRYLDNDAHNSYAALMFAYRSFEGDPGKMPGDQTNRLIKFSDFELDLDAAVLRSGVKHGTRFSAAAKSVVSVAV